MRREQIQAAVAAAPRDQLDTLARAVWDGLARGELSEDDAQGLAEAIAARRTAGRVTGRAAGARRSIGSRPRTTESIARRRRWAASGWMPPQLAASFTAGELAALSVIAAEAMKGRGCRLVLAAIAAAAGCCKTTVRSAIRHAQALGLLTSEEWRLSAYRSAPNLVRITSPEWLSWLAHRGRNGGGSKSPHRSNTKVYPRGCETLPDNGAGEQKGPPWRFSQGRPGKAPGGRTMA